MNKTNVNRIEKFIKDLAAMRDSLGVIKPDEELIQKIKNVKEQNDLNDLRKILSNRKPVDDKQASALNAIRDKIEDLSDYYQGKVLDTDFDSKWYDSYEMAADSLEDAAEALGEIDDSLRDLEDDTDIEFAIDDIESAYDDLERAQEDLEEARNEVESAREGIEDAKKDLIKTLNSEHIGSPVEDIKYQIDNAIRALEIAKLS